MPLINSKKQLDEAIDAGMYAVMIGKPKDRQAEMRLFLTAAVTYLEAMEYMTAARQ